jgi:ATP-binding cassette subfamily F protein uup
LAASPRGGEKRGEGASPTTGKADAAAKKARKLNNKERAELDALPKKIEALEAEQTVLTAKLADPHFFKKPATEVTQATVRLHEIEAELARAYARWSELEG